jgi:hypothetical protein
MKKTPAKKRVTRSTVLGYVIPEEFFNFRDGMVEAIHLFRDVPRHPTHRVVKVILCKNPKQP